MKNKADWLLALSKSLSLIALSVITLNACGGFFTQVRLTRHEPDKANLIGTWVPDQATLEDMRVRGGYDTSVSTKLILQSDGSFQLFNMPDWWDNGSGDSYRGVHSYSGTWRISQNSGTTIWKLHLAFLGRLRPVHLLEQRPPYRVYFVLGDPDSGNSMTFVKN